MKEHRKTVHSSNPSMNGKNVKHPVDSWCRKLVSAFLVVSAAISLSFSLAGCSCSREGIESRTIRCSMPSREQQHHGLAQNPKISKSLYESTNRYLGANLTVERNGLLRSGDDVELLD